MFAVACLAGVVVVSGAGAAGRMWVGFTDDPTFRFGTDRQASLDLAARGGATIIRTVAIWSSIARSRPVDASDPFEPSYRFDDLDELVRNAQTRGLEVLITIWGTPSWANNARGPQYAPTDASDLQDFAQAIASRYSGRYPGYPFVRFFGIWNESNLSTFLRPQFDASGRIVGPAIYARLAAAGYAGIKAGNPAAQVAIGRPRRTVARSTSPASLSQSRPASSPSSSREPTRSCASTRGRNTRIRSPSTGHRPRSSRGRTSR